jgi:hypothetical protein
MDNMSQTSEENTRAQQVFCPELSGRLLAARPEEARSRQSHAKGTKKAKTKVPYFLCVLCVLCAFA